MSKHIELAKKLKALADRGVGGEKLNAKKMLNALMKKHHITIEDIEGEKQKEYFLKLDSTQIKLFNQIAKKINRNIKIHGEFTKKHIRQYKLKGNFMIICTPCEFIEIEGKYDFYSKLYTSELSIFFTSFLKANDLLLSPTDDNYVPTEEELEKWKRIEEMANKIKSDKFRKQLSTPIM